MDNSELYEKALQAITELFSDMEVSRLETRRNLESLIGEIQVMIETLSVGEE